MFVKLHHTRLLDSDKPSILKQNYKIRNPLMLQWASFGDFLQRYSRCGKILVSSAVLAKIARIWCLHVPFNYGQSYYWSTLTEYGIMSGFSEENPSTSSTAPGRITSTSLSRADLPLQPCTRDHTIQGAGKCKARPRSAWQPQCDLLNPS